MEARRPRRVAQPDGLLNLMRSAWQEYERDYARYYAAAMVFYALITLMPLLMLLLGGLGLLLRHSDFAASTAQQLLQVIEAGFGAQLRETAELLSEGLQQGSTVATAVSLIGLLLTTSKLIHHLRMTF